MITSLNLFYCNKITDRGCIGVRNLWAKTLILNDLYQLTDRSFHFDREGDGRPAVDAHMLEHNAPGRNGLQSHHRFWISKY